ncbi:50S ribosomal protein L25 [Candidatus Uhrbacteria bacterium]|nr:50S ribosomal protein L25 [Candidatus Uhrbacteria bacterium]
MNNLTLEAQARTQKGRKTNTLRAQGLVPAVVYGADTQPQSIVIDRNQFAKMYKAAGESSIVELVIDGRNALHVLIHDYQTEPLRDEVTHVDFQSVDMKKEIEAEIQLKFVGESPAVKALGGTLMASLDEVKVRCLPSKLVRDIEVDISKLVTFEDVIRLSDLTIPEGVTIVDDLHLSVASVTAPRSEEELKALDEAVVEDVTAVAVEKKKEEEPVEGAQAAPDEKDKKVEKSGPKAGTGSAGKADKK